tara:strand:+ start:564 stop:716 length:153 start_codon:yes stop_codon:yes gene_type:complete
MLWRKENKTGAVRKTRILFRKNPIGEKSKIEKREKKSPTKQRNIYTGTYL